MTSVRFLGIVAGVLAAVGCGSAGGPAVAGAPPQPRAEAVALSAEAQARADSVRRPYTEADIHFMSVMIGHHAQAILMSEKAPTHGASPVIRTLATRIINAQRDEITTMQLWLRDRRKPVPEAKPAGMTMMMNGVEHTMPMAGMLSDAQMVELDAARGEAFDRLFLRYMIQHHRGAVSMVQQLFASPGAAQNQTVFKFASDVSVDQATEIARMERMLGALVLQGTPPRP